MSRSPLTDNELHQTLRAVVRCGSMTAASAELWLTHPAVHYRITRLERREGAKLFTRFTGKVPRNMTLTDAGREFLGSLE